MPRRKIDSTTDADVAAPIPSVLQVPALASPPGLEKLAKEIDRGFRNIRDIAPADEDASSLYERRIREFREGVVALTLRSARDTVVAAHERCLAAGALDEGSALTGPDGVRMFSVTPGGSPADCMGLAVVRGDDRFATFVGPYSPDSPDRDVTGEDITVVQWKAPPPADLTAELDGLPKDPDALDPEQVSSLATRLSAYALPGSRLDLGHIASEMVAGETPWGEARVASVSEMRFTMPDSSFTRLRGQTEDKVAAWQAYADVMRPLVMAEGHEPLTERQMWDLTGFGSMAAVEAAKVDGGFYGAAGAWAEEAISGSTWRFRLAHMASAFARLAEDTIAAGYVWGERALTYADLDRHTFAVASPDGRVLGRWHRNSDLIAPIQAHMAVVVRDDTGNPTRVEIHAAHSPFGGYREERWPTSRKLIESLVSSMGIYSDENADPPRLTRRALADRIASGQPLPQPAGGIDLVTGELLPGTSRDALQSMENAFYGYREDRWAMDQIAARKKPGYVRRNVKDFAEEGEDPEAGTRRSRSRGR